MLLYETYEFDYIFHFGMVCNIEMSFAIGFLLYFGIFY